MCIFAEVFKALVLLILLNVAVVRVNCLNFNFPNVPMNTVSSFITSNYSEMALNAIQVTLGSRVAPVTNLSGRVLYKQKFKLWNRRSNINTTASFSTTFSIRIVPITQPGGEGMAFILTADPEVPENSSGQWLGIVNGSTNGSSQGQIVAVEFDTRKSFPEDIDNNHVGVNVNGIKSITQFPLSSHGINLSGEADVLIGIHYNGKSKRMVIFMSKADERESSTENPVISVPLDLPQHLPEDVYVGFSASTSNFTEMNCVTSWNFTGESFASSNQSSNRKLWMKITIPVVVGGFIYCCCFERGKESEDQEIKQKIKDSIVVPKEFRLKDLKSATKKFHPANKPGEGGFGKVYKGHLEGMDVAIKRLSKNSHQGKQEFVAEVTTISHLEHKNLVKLLGWCCGSNELLIYKFMPNGSLEKFLFSHENTGSWVVLQSWKLRLSIICRVALALDYLHVGCNQRVLHRDVKATNVMLDSEFNALLGDFGLARIIQQAGKTHHSTEEIAGTPGYMAPEYVLSHRASVKTDVYGFGVLLMEAACGRMPVNNGREHDNREDYIVDWLWDIYGKGKILDAVVTRIHNDLNEEQMERTLKLGLACCHPDPNQRPFIRMVLRVLSGETAPPILPAEKPAFVWPVMQDISELSSSVDSVQKEILSTELSSERSMDFQVNTNDDLGYSSW